MLSLRRVLRTPIEASPRGTQVMQWWRIQKNAKLMASSFNKKYVLPVDESVVRKPPSDELKRMLRTILHETLKFYFP